MLLFLQSILKSWKLENSAIGEFCNWSIIITLSPIKNFNQNLSKPFAKKKKKLNYLKLELKYRA